MKKILFVAMILGGFIVSCRKGSTDGSTTTTSSKGTSMPKGTPIGNAITKTIGPSGGTISSTDNNITVTVPAGAEKHFRRSHTAFVRLKWSFAK